MSRKRKAKRKILKVPVPQRVRLQFGHERGLPLWVPEREDGWILVFPGNAQLWFAEDQKTVWGYEDTGFSIKRVM